MEIKKLVLICVLVVFLLPLLFSQTQFSSDAAIQRSIEIVKEHWENYDNGVSRYYGRVWLDSFAKHQYLGDKTFYDDYIQELNNRNLKRIRMDCTIYCAKVLKAGMDAEEYSKLLNYHNQIWAGKGFAGWSVGHLLVDKFGWKAYAFIEPGARSFDHYLNHFKDKKEYPVWNQPHIKIEDYFILGEDDSEIEELLRNHKFSWGFSEDGIHTWITSYKFLLECHWDGTPAAKYNYSGSLPDLFETTRFIEFKDYDVHIIVVPPQ